MLNNHPSIRLGLYLLAVAGGVLAPILAVTHPEYGAAVVTASGVLMAAAGITAASNLQNPPPAP